MIARPGAKALVLGDGQQMVAPIYRDDVVAALLAAARRGAAGTYELAGPERMSVDHLVRLLSRSARARITHVPAGLARLLGMLLPSLPGPLVDVMLRPSLGDPTAAVAEFGLTLTPLGSVWTADATAARRPAPSGLH
jgi:uncharacterized protein YbjT (DUF2867 family)